MRGGEVEGLALVAVTVVGYGLVSKRLEGSVVTAPMVFVAVGLVVGEGGLSLTGFDLDQSAVRILAEATLVIVLFTDAIAIRVRDLEREAALTARLLGIGMPLTILLGTAAGLLVLGDLSLWEVALLATILAPTDAALGQAVVSDTRVPQRIRHALSTESGLNDGIALPAVMLFVALAANAEELESAGYWVGFALRQIGYGTLVGAAVGAAGGMVIDRAVRAGWVNGTFRQLATIALGVGAFAFAELAGGNGFIAAFAAGIAFGQVARDQCPHIADFAEDEGHLLVLVTFLLFGATIAGPALSHLTPSIALYAVLSLTIVRMLPIAVSLLGTDVAGERSAFMGWFGPRGLASILFVVLVVEEANLTVTDTLIDVVSWTVLLSIAAHGITAAPWARALGTRTQAPARPRVR